MTLVKTEPATLSEPRETLHVTRWYGWVLSGAFCSLASAVGYTAANVFLRTVSDVDAIWVSTIKAVPTVLMIGPILFWYGVRGTTRLPPLRPWLMLAAAGLFGQLCGNVTFQWSLGQIGIALAVPITLGAMILSGALLGKWRLGESVARRAAAASILVIAAIVILSLGADQARDAVVSDAGTTAWAALAGILSAVLAGVAYAALGVAIRRGSQQGIDLPWTLMTVGVIGVVALGGISLGRWESAGIGSTSAGDFGWMFAAGVCNAIAFLALTRALQVSSVVFVNAVNASQVAMAAVAGVLLFGEPPSWTMWTGVTITMAALMILKPSRRATVEGAT